MLHRKIARWTIAAVTAAGLVLATIVLIYALLLAPALIPRAAADGPVGTTVTACDRRVHG